MAGLVFMKNIFTIRWLLAAFLLSLMALSGCTTPQPRALTKDELKTFFDAARDPRFFWLTVYEGENGPLITGGNRRHSSQAARLYWDNGKHSPQPRVEVQNHKGTYLTALLDFTTAPSWTSFEGCAKLNARPVGPPVFERRPEHVLDDARCFLTVVPKIRFENLNMENVLVYTRAVTGNPGPLMRCSKGDQVDLIIGTDLLMELSFIHLNPVKQYVVLASTQKYPLEDKSLIASTPYTRINGVPTVTALMEGQKIPLVLDPAGDFELALPKAPNEPIRQLSIGDLVFRSVAATNFASVGIPENSMPRLGRRIIDKFILTLDTQRGAWHWEKPLK